MQDVSVIIRKVRGLSNRNYDDDDDNNNNNNNNNKNNNNNNNNNIININDMLTTDMRWKRS